MKNFNFYLDLKTSSFLHLFSSIQSLSFTFFDVLGTCEFGPAWADKASDEDTAHEEVECSNAGICDRSTASCKCFTAYTG